MFACLMIRLLICVSSGKTKSFMRLILSGHPSTNALTKKDVFPLRTGL